MMMMTRNRDASPNLKHQRKCDVSDALFDDVVVVVDDDDVDAR